ncbi:MAG: deaminase [Verrucomicrobia bacterium]|nr:deaminase [Verrucomicrobiota bacterium]
MKIFYRDEIEEAVDYSAILKAIEESFSIYSQGEAVIPSPAALHFEDPPGDCHIKYGFAKKGDYYVVKIASGFSHNPQIGLPSNNGLMILFDKKTGETMALLLDKGYLTDIRTAAAGAVTAKYLAPTNVTSIGIVGTGAQAFYQLQWLKFATSCRQVMVWGRDAAKARQFCNHPDLQDFQMSVAKDLDELTASCNLIVTTTTSAHPLLFAHQIRAGTHITAVGADDVGKQELDPFIFTKADHIFVDSRRQCALVGDTSYALQKGLIQEKQMIEIGEAILNPELRRTSDDQITIADLTGVAIQDLQIAIQAYQALDLINSQKD